MLQAMQLFAFCVDVKQQIQGEQQDTGDKLGQLAGVVTQFQGKIQGLQSFLGVQSSSMGAGSQETQHEPQQGTCRS